MIGYYRDNCSEKCSPPNYGEDCQSVCQCPDIDCQFVTGCFQNTGTLTYHWQLSIVISSFYNNYVNTLIPVLNHTLIHMKQLNTIFARQVFGPLPTGPYKPFADLITITQ